MAPPGGGSAFLRLTSLADNAQQRLDGYTIQEWGYSSAYFVGDKIRVELLTYPGTSTSRVNIDKVAYQPDPQNCNPIPAGMCGATDDRQLSADPRAARFRFSRSPGMNAEERWCSAFLIDRGANWFLTAGHCYYQVSWNADFKPVVEFGVPLSSGLSGVLYPPPPEQQFPVRRGPAGFPTFWVQAEDILTTEWCFFGADRNSNTRLTPLQTQGASFRLADVVPPADGSTLRVTGYGVDDSPFKNCGVQQSAAGPYLDLNGGVLRFGVDAQNRNSGSPVEHVCGSVYAILTDGTCVTQGGNLGTSVTYAPLVDALTPNVIDAGTTEPQGPAADCNGNGIKDWCEVDCGLGGGACNVPGCGTAANCNGNLIPDDCEPNVDCNANTIRDISEVGTPSVPDCNGNAVPDSCDIAGGFSGDGNCNAIPDECDICVGTETDTNNNRTPDPFRACCYPSTGQECVLATSPCCNTLGGTYYANKSVCSLAVCGAMGPGGP